MSRVMIASVDRALAVVDRVAAKHGMTAAALVATPRNRAVILARGEVMHALNVELGWSYQRAANLLGLSVSRLHSAHTEWKGVQANIARYLPEDLRAAPDTLADLKAQLEASEVARLDAERRLAAVLGLESIDVFMKGLDLLPRAAIVLTVLAESYPNHVRVEQILNYYDAACLRLDYGAKRGATRELLYQNNAALRRTFAARGWPNPVGVGPANKTHVLTHDAADLLHEKIGVPSTVQIGRRAPSFAEIAA
ncbi:MAG: hypothetical protein E6Q97_27695 [Desulfurellales bacterium]|nr:MAG: hypothetical protein E6Q97_27695 [Desulfurellales bacterium]